MLKFSKEAVSGLLPLFAQSGSSLLRPVGSSRSLHTHAHTHTHTHTLAAQHFIPSPRVFQQKCLLLLVQLCDNFHLYQVTESYVSLSQDDLFPSHPQTETIRESNVSFSSVAWKRWRTEERNWSRRLVGFGTDILSCARILCPSVSDVGVTYKIPHLWKLPCSRIR
jgi:hypothetical protein